MKNKVHFIGKIADRLLILFLGSGLLVGCYVNKIEPQTVCAPTAKDSVSFSQDIQPILNQHCATSGCHAGSFPGGSLNLESSVAYTELTRAKSGYLNTSNPTQSLLYSQLQSSSSSPMPPSYRLDDCSINTIVKWMGQKAKNN
ncbi:MAG: hypothetical protein K2Q22_05920 [Cytophagales bacterium]|nr:hypothetical protein [Cytophagales bacterium]